MLSLRDFSVFFVTQKFRRLGIQCTIIKGIVHIRKEKNELISTEHKRRSFIIIWRDFFFFLDESLYLVLKFLLFPEIFP